MGASMPAVEGNKKLLARWRSLTTHHSHLSPAQGGGRSWHRVLWTGHPADRLPGFVGPFPPPLWIRVRAYSVGSMLAFGRKRCQADRRARLSLRSVRPTGSTSARSTPLASVGEMRSHTCLLVPRFPPLFAPVAPYPQQAASSEREKQAADRESDDEAPWVGRQNPNRQAKNCSYHGQRKPTEPNPHFLPTANHWKVAAL